MWCNLIPRRRCNLISWSCCCQLYGKVAAASANVFCSYLELDLYQPGQQRSCNKVLGHRRLNTASNRYIRAQAASTNWKTQQICTIYCQSSVCPFAMIAPICLTTPSGMLTRRLATALKPPPHLFQLLRTHVQQSNPCKIPCKNILVASKPSVCQPLQAQQPSRQHMFLNGPQHSHRMTLTS